MIKQKTNAQNIIIIVLSILLLISIGFGVTYSYYNGKSNLVKGSITTANLSISLQGYASGQTTEFSISAPFGEDFLTPGSNLNNVQLNLINKCTQSTYMLVLYSLSAIKNDGTNLDVTSQLTNIPAISFRDGAFDADVWRHISYKCANRDATFTCLVGINPFDDRGETSGVTIPVFKENLLKIPEQWNNTLQNCNVTISIMAYAIQSVNLEEAYRTPIDTADQNHNMEAKAQAIAKAILEICKVDIAVSE